MHNASVAAGSVDWFLVDDLGFYLKYIAAILSSCAAEDAAGEPRGIFAMKEYVRDARTDLLAKGCITAPAATHHVQPAGGMEEEDEPQPAAVGMRLSSFFVENAITRAHGALLLCNLTVSVCFLLRRAYEDDDALSAASSYERITATRVYRTITHKYRVTGGAKCMDEPAGRPATHP